MLEEKKSVLDKPEVLRRETTLEPVKKGKGWIFKIVLILIVLALVIYLFMNPEVVVGPVNKFFEGLLK